MIPEIVSSVGLGLDIAGVGLLYKFGLPSEASPPSAFKSLHVQVKGEDDLEEDRRRWNRYRSGSRLGLAALTIGFVLQLVANWIP